MPHDTFSDSNAEFSYVASSLDQLWAPNGFDILFYYEAGLAPGKIEVEIKNSNLSIDKLQNS